MSNRIDEIRERCEAYFNTYPNVDRTDYAIGYNVVRIKSELTGDNYNEKFSELAAHAIRDIPYLLSELAACNKEIERLSQVALMRDGEIGDRDREIERLKDIIEPECPACHLKNHRVIIDRYCHRCGTNMTLSAPPVQPQKPRL